MSISILTSKTKSLGHPLSCFKSLSDDCYLQGEYIYRQRAYGVARYHVDDLIWEENTSFFQDSSLNTYAGGVLRSFDKLSLESKKYVDKLIKFIIDESCLERTDYYIGCHQIRIIANETFNGYPTPEGFHQDGFDFVAVNCISQDNVNGGLSLVKLLGDDKTVYEYKLVPGDVMLFDDREVEHYVTPITPKIPGNAYRDVFVVTFNQIRH